MANENLMEMGRSLGDEISKVRGDCTDVSIKIEEILRSRKNSRGQYDSCLNAGDQVGMGACLGEIRKANKEIEVLKLRYEIFEKELPALHEKHKKMRDVQQQNIKSAAESLKVAKELKKGCGDEQNVCLGMLDKLNELKNLIDKESRSFGKI